PIAAQADCAAAAMSGKVLQVRRSLERLSSKYPGTTVQSTVLSDPGMLREVAALGRELFLALFGATGEGHAQLDEMKDLLRNAAVRHQEAMEASFAERIDVTVRGRSTDALRQWLSLRATWTRCDLLYVFGHARVSGTVSVNGVPNGRWPDDDAVIDLDSEKDA